VGLLLHDTCSGAKAPVCSRLGRMFIPGFVTRNEQKALRASKAYCELLGTPWECLDARERVLRQRPPDLAAAASFVAGACKVGSPRACVIWAIKHCIGWIRMLISAPSINCSQAVSILSGFLINGMRCCGWRDH